MIKDGERNRDLKRRGEKKSETERDWRAYAHQGRAQGGQVQRRMIMT